MYNVFSSLRCNVVCSWIELLFKFGWYVSLDSVFGDCNVLQSFRIVSWMMFNLVFLLHFVFSTVWKCSLSWLIYSEQFACLSVFCTVISFSTHTLMAQLSHFNGSRGQKGQVKLSRVSCDAWQRLDSLGCWIQLNGLRVQNIDSIGVLYAYVDDLLLG